MSRPTVAVRQTAAMFVDAVRDLRAGRLFWVALIISAVLPLSLLVIGINESGLTVFGRTLETNALTSDQISLGRLYMLIFAILGVPLWLTWGATILAIVSTAGMIPQFLTSGTVEFSLAKPIGRFRLFLTKWSMGLLFAVAQVGVFCLTSFLVVWLRGGLFAPELLLAIPIVVSVFAYLFAICGLFGVITRSANTALMLTLVVWFALFVLGTTEGAFLQQRVDRELDLLRAQERVEARERFARQELERRGVEAPYSEAQLDGANPMLPFAREQAANDQAAAETWTVWHERIVTARTALPKTSETTDMLRRWVVSPDDLERLMRPDATEGTEDLEPAEMSEADPEEASERRSERRFNSRREEMAFDRMMELSERPVWWVLGTSYAFTAVVLLIASVLFARKDF